MYATLDDLLGRVDRLRVIQLSNDDDDPVVDENEQPAINEAVVGSTLADAVSRVNGYISAQSPIPLSSPIPDIIKTVTVDIWVYNLFSRKYDVGSEDEPGTGAILRRYKDAIRILEKIAAGDMQLRQPVDQVIVRAPRKAFGGRFRQEYD